MPLDHGEEQKSWTSLADLCYANDDDDDDGDSDEGDDQREV